MNVVIDHYPSLPICIAGRDDLIPPRGGFITHPLDVRKARDLSEYMKIYAFFHRTMSNQSLTTRPSSDIINTNIAQSDDRGK